MSNMLTLMGAFDNWQSIVLIVVLVVAFVGLIWFSSYSQKKKQKQAVEMNQALKVGDKVKTIGGVVGTIVGVDENNGNFEIETGTSTMVFDRNAVYPMNYFDAQNAKTKPAKDEIDASAEEPVAEIEADEQDEVPAGGDVAPEGSDSKSDKKE